MKAIFVGGKYNGFVLDAEELTNLKGFTGNFTEDLSELRNKGCVVHRAELDNQPIIQGYLSPMFDGGKLRYETQEVYDMLSR